MKYNRKEIMKKAWELHRSAQRGAEGVQDYCHETKTYIPKVVKFGDSLKWAWQLAKEAVKQAEIKATPHLRIEQIDERIFHIEMGRMGTKEFNEVMQLKKERAELVARMAQGDAA